MTTALEIHTISDANIERLLADPPLVWLFLHPEDPDLYHGEVSEQRRPGLLGRIFGSGGNGEGDDPEPPEMDLVEGEGEVIPLEGSWQVIHYLLTKDAGAEGTPLGFLQAGGETVGEVDLGRGPARAFRAATLASIRDALAELDRSTLEERFDAEDMIRKDVEGDLEHYLEEDIGTFLRHFYDLKSGIEEAASAGLGALLVPR